MEKEFSDRAMRKVNTEADASHGAHSVRISDVLIPNWSVRTACGRFANWLRLYVMYAYFTSRSGLCFDRFFKELCHLELFRSTTYIQSAGLKEQRKCKPSPGSVYFDLIVRPRRSDRPIACCSFLPSSLPADRTIFQANISAGRTPSFLNAAAAAHSPFSQTLDAALHPRR